MDFDFAKEQLLLMLRSLYSHPNGQMPAYEWNFSDVNPPVHAWATLFLYKFEKNLGREDLPFLERSFQGLMLNFNWWVNRKDPQGRNVFAGGFLGLDNIGVFDRSAPLPTGGSLEQADGTAWMAFYCQNMLEMAVILADHDPMYEEVAFKFLENFIWISYAMDKAGEQRDDMWDEEDGFFYDVLRLPDGDAFRLKVRSMVGLLPLCASTVFEEDIATRHPKLVELIALFKKRHPAVVAHVAPTIDGFIGHAGRRLLSPLTRDEARAHPLLRPRRERVPRPLRHPLPLAPPPRASVRLPGRRPGASRPVPSRRVQHGDVRGELELARAGVDAGQRALIRGLLNLYGFYGDDFKVECPTGSGNRMTLFEVAKEISRRLSAIFLRDASGRRPVYGGSAKFQDDPHWRDLILFYEYFHGDNGAGLGASHQTGWTGLVARSLDLFGRVTAEDALAFARRTSMPAWSGGRSRASRRRPGDDMKRTWLLGGLVLWACLAAGDVRAQEAEKTAGEKAWSFSASAYTYLLPDETDYAQPTVTADRGRLHLEARYNYEDLHTGSLWIGYNVSFGQKVTVELHPHPGRCLGSTDGIAPGYKAVVAWRKLELSSESEYVFDLADSSESFLYTWSELGWGPVDWLRVGLVVQRTKVYETEFDIQRGFLVGLAYKNASFTTYVFNPDASHPTVVLGATLSF